MLLGGFRQMTADFGEEPRCSDEHKTPTIIVAGGDRDALSELPRKLFDGVLLVSASRLQAGSARTRATATTTRSHDDRSWRIRSEIAIVSRRERVFECLEGARWCAGLAQLEYGGVTRVCDENGIAAHRRGLRREMF
jgi:hypothetical protein